MRMVMLHLFQPQTLPIRPCLPVLGRAVFGVQIDRHNLGPVIEQGRVIRIRLDKGIPRQGLIQLAQMMAQQRLPVLDQTDRRFHLPTIGHDLRCALKPRGQRDRPWHLPPRTAQHHPPPPHQALDTVIQPARNIAVVHDEPVDNRGQLVARLLVADHLRLARQVARGHHQGPAHGTDQQMVQRRIGQHPPHHPLPRRDPVRQARLALLQHHNRRRRITKRLVRPVTHHRIALNRLHFRHDGQGLCGPVLARPQRGNRIGVQRVTDQMKPADPLDGQYLSRPQPRGRLGNRITLDLGLKPDTRTTVGTGHGLGMEPAVGGILILCSAGLTHGKARHAGHRPIIGQTRNNRKPRPAMGAIGKRVSKPAIIRIHHLAQTGLADRRIGRHPRFGPRATTGDNLERPRERALNLDHLNRIHPCQRRCLAPNRGDKRINLPARGPDQHPLGVIPDPTGHPEPTRNPPDKGTKAHALHLPAHTDFHGPAHPRASSAWSKYSGGGRRRGAAPPITTGQTHAAINAPYRPYRGRNCARYAEPTGACPHPLAPPPRPVPPQPVPQRHPHRGG